MAVSTGLGPLFACLGVLVLACSEEPTFVDDASSGGGGQGTGAASSGGSASGGSASGGSASGGSASGGAPTGGGTPGGGGGGGGGPMPICGDGLINLAPEQCDDGNPVDDDGCTGCVVDCPAGGYKDPVTFHCYFMLTQEPWANARQDCIDTAFGTDAAALSTLEEFDVVTAHFLGQGFTSQTWIGGVGVNGLWQWANGEPWIYADDTPPWIVGAPSNLGDCTRINPKGGGDREMRDDNCLESKPVICERTPAGS